MPQENLILIATRHQSHYERLKSHEVALFDEFLKKMDRDIRRQLSGFEITDLTRKKLELQLRDLRALLRGTLDDYAKVWYDSVNEAAIYEAGFELRALGNVVTGVNFTLPSDSQITAAVFNTPLGNIGGPDGGSLLEPFLEGMNERTIKRVEGAIRIGYAEGQTTAQILQRVRGTKAAGFRDGVMANVKGDAEAITRTALQHAASQATAEIWKANEDVIEGRVWLSTLDEKTSAQCQSLDGMVFPLDEGPFPPAHIRCRSKCIAKLKSEFSYLSEGRQRSARDPVTGEVGTVSAKQTYYGWLKDQPESVQDSIIGPTRGALLRDGGLSAERFAELQLGKNFQPANLAQMREMDPLAFAKAGL